MMALSMCGLQRLSEQLGGGGRGGGGGGSASIADLEMKRGFRGTDAFDNTTLRYATPATE